MRLLLALLSLLLIIGGAIVIDRLQPQHSPFTPLDLEQPVGWATPMKLRALSSNPEVCGAVLERSAMEFARIEDRSEGPFCGFTGAVAVERSMIPYSAPLRVSCPLAAVLYLWEREVVAPAAARHFGSKVARVQHLGTYACRRVAGSASGRPSQHATANAIDIAGFRLADGKEVSVLRDWAGGNSAAQAFLRDVRDGGCRLFQAVLGPDYNAAHRDHLHLDMGPYGMCR